MWPWSQEDVVWGFTGGPMGAADPVASDTPRSVTVVLCTAAAFTIAGVSIAACTAAKAG
jgi:hypothetical protein